MEAEVTNTKITDETVYRFGWPFGRTIEIVKVSVDYGDTGFNCWGYRFGTEGAVPGALTYNPNWTTPGDALNAAHEERSAINKG